MQLEVRAASGGEVLFRDQLQKAIVDVSVADLRNDGTVQVLATLENGEIRGYVTVSMNSLSKAKQDEHDYDLLQQVRHRCCVHVDDKPAWLPKQRKH
jgi:Ciliary BBSome complex subunit 2, C-terminal